MANVSSASPIIPSSGMRSSIEEIYASLWNNRAVKNLSFYMNQDRRIAVGAFVVANLVIITLASSVSNLIVSRLKTSIEKRHYKRNVQGALKGVSACVLTFLGNALFLSVTKYELSRIILIALPIVVGFVKFKLSPLESLSIKEGDARHKAQPNEKEKEDVIQNKDSLKADQKEQDKAKNEKNNALELEALPKVLEAEKKLHQKAAKEVERLSQEIAIQKAEELAKEKDAKEALKLAQKALSLEKEKSGKELEKLEKEKSNLAEKLVKKDLEIAKAASPIIQGLNLEIQCQKDCCSPYRNKLIKLGTGTFKLHDIIEKAFCPVCKEKQKPNLAVFYKCKIKINGEKTNFENLTEPLQYERIADDKKPILSVNLIQNWTSLTIEAEPI
jgi:Ca2+/Na+ antiporter